MTVLRDQLQSARSDYLDAKFPGDLAALLPPETSARPAVHWRWQSAWQGSLLAASLALVALGHFLLGPGDYQSIKTARPATLMNWAPRLKGPVADWSREMVDAGKDIAHKTDALIEIL